jgi:Family of unknown function (DUF6220)
MRKGITTLYAGLAMLIATLVLVQFFLAGLGWFDPSVGFDAHETVGFIIHTLTAVLFLLSIAGPRTRRDMGMSFALLVIATIQIALPDLRDDAPVLAAFHPLVALVIGGLAHAIGRRYIGGRGASPAPAG